MTYIQSMEDLARAKAEAQERLQANDRQYQFQIQIGMSSCGIAVGARETLAAFDRLLVERKLSKVRITQTGCIGSCALEPIVQLKETDRATITYGKVSPEVAQRIIEEHIGSGRIVQEYVVENV